MEEQYSLTYLDTTHPITMDRFRMILANPAAQTKGWVIVEGEADNIAYSRFLNGTDRMVMKAGYTAKDNTEHGDIVRSHRRYHRYQHHHRGHRES